MMLMLLLMVMLLMVIDTLGPEARTTKEKEASGISSLGLLGETRANVHPPRRLRMNCCTSSLTHTRADDSNTVLPSICHNTSYTGISHIYAYTINNIPEGAYVALTRGM